LDVSPSPRRWRARSRRSVPTLAAAVGDAFTAGIVLDTGTRSYRLEDRMYVMPIDRL
jgi:hypothetical protein